MRLAKVEIVERSTIVAAISSGELYWPKVEIRERSRIVAAISSGELYLPNLKLTNVHQLSLPSPAASSTEEAA
jgi:hypothetical protein